MLITCTFSILAAKTNYCIYHDGFTSSPRRFHKLFNKTYFRSLAYIPLEMSCLQLKFVNLAQLGVINLGNHGNSNFEKHIFILVA